MKKVILALVFSVAMTTMAAPPGWSVIDPEMSYDSYPVLIPRTGNVGSYGVPGVNYTLLVENGKILAQIAAGQSFPHGIEGMIVSIEDGVEKIDFGNEATYFVNTPEVRAKDYTGESMSAEVPATNGQVDRNNNPALVYEVTYNEPHTDAGTYDVELQLLDPVNYRWADSEDDWIVVPFTILQATNNWTTPPSITGWTYGETAHVPTAGAKFGNVKVTYDGTVADGTVIRGATSVTKAGDYEAVFTVAGNRNYTGLTNRVPFTVAKAGVPGFGGGGDISVNVSGYEELYDGQGHSITVALSGSDAPSFTVTYALNGNGPFSAAKPMFTNVCNATVWYVLSSPDYATVTNSATVTITKRSVTLTSGSASKVYDGTPITCADVLISGDGFVIGEGATYNITGSQTTVGTSKNTFAYALNEGTLVGNYVITTTNGTLTVTEAYKPLVIRCEWEEGTIKPDSMDCTILTNGTAWQVITVSAAGDWKQSLDVKVYADGQPVDYALSVEPVNSVRTQVETFGCRRMGSLRSIDRVLTESGWQDVGPLNAQAVVYTVDGWQRFGAIVMDVLVVAEAPERGEFFKMVNTQASFDIDDGTEGGTGGASSRFSYSGVYDGMGHGIDVVITNAPAGTSIKYARGDASVPPAEGWLAVNPLFTNVCDKAVVWYAVECEGYDSYTNNATVTITPKTLTAGNVWLEMPPDAYVYDGTAKVPEVACGDGTPSIISTNDFDVSFTHNVGAGTAFAVFTGKNNYTGTVTENFDVAKQVVQAPSIPDKEYNGEIQTADVPDSARYKVTFNEGGRAVGTYVVILELTDAANYRWAGSEGASRYLRFAITKAAIDVSHVGWDYSAPLPYTAYPQEILLTNLPAGVTATYTGNKATETGTYTAHATLNYNTDNYVAAAIPDCVWTIKPAVPIGGGNVDSLGGDTINYSGVYDGEGHGISVILRDPRPAGARVRYSVSKDGPYSDVNPIFTNACRETVWYLVTADNYEALTNSATVTIDPKPFTVGLVKHKGLREVEQDGSSTIVPTLVIEDDWPCQLTERDWELVAWTPKAAGGGTAVVRGRRNYTGQVTVEIGNEMTVLFDAVYGTDGEALRTMTTQEPGKPFVFPTDPIYRGHEFLGWFTAKDGGEQIARGAIVSLSDPDTLYAHWGVRSFRISFELNGGTGEMEDLDAEYGSSFGELATPKKPGYLFDGWWTTEDFQRGTRVAEGDSVPYKDTTLYAKWLRRKLWYTDATFHLEGAVKYDGYLVDPTAGDVVAGTLQVKAGKPNKKTGASKLTVTVLLAGRKKIVLKGPTFDGTFKGEAGGMALDLALGFSSMSGTLGRYVIDGTRNVFTAKDADSKITAAQALKRWQGVYVAAWEGAAGWNGLSLEVKAKGKVKVKGVLADGTKVSVSSQLLVGERECALAVSYTKKAASVACLVWLCEDGSVECGNMRGGASALIANARAGARLAAGAAFRTGSDALAGVVPGLLHDLLPDGQEVRMKGTAFDIDKAGKAKLLKDKSGVDPSGLGTNPSGLKLKYTMKNGTFKGTFNAYALDGGKLKKVKVTVSGVVLGGRGYGTASVKKPAASWPVEIR